MPTNRIQPVLGNRLPHLGIGLNFWRIIIDMNEIFTLISDRDLRQRGLVPSNRLAQCDAIVIGVGAIGRQVALQLAALGISRMTRFDDDRVQPENLAAQGYWPEDLNG